MAGAGERNGKILEEIMAISFQNLTKTVSPQIQESQQTPSIRNMKKTAWKCIPIKLSKTMIEKKILKLSQSRERHYI